MTVRYPAFIVFCLAISLSATAASAGLILETGIRGVYEDNITASAADIGKKGDYYAVTLVSLGGYKGVGNDTYLFLRGDAAGYLYRRYSDLNAAVAGVVTGVYKELDAKTSAEAGLHLARKEFGESHRSSTAYGASCSLKRYLLPKLWLRWNYEFEDNAARHDIYSYTGHLVGLSSGYSFSPMTMLELGYSYLSRSYREPAGFRNRFHTISLGLSEMIARKVRLYGSYGRQFNGSNVPGTSHTNNIISVGISYSY